MNRVGGTKEKRGASLKGPRPKGTGSETGISGGLLETPHFLNWFRLVWGYLIAVGLSTESAALVSRRGERDPFPV